MRYTKEEMESDFRKLCLRLLDIDSRCLFLDNETSKGCPANLVAFPMIEAWIKVRKGQKIPEAAIRMCRADGQGKGCEIDEIQYLAREFLKTHP